MHTLTDLFWFFSFALILTGCNQCSQQYHSRRQTWQSTCSWKETSERQNRRTCCPPSQSNKYSSCSTAGDRNLPVHWPSWWYWYSWCGWSVVCNILCGRHVRLVPSKGGSHLSQAQLHGESNQNQCTHEIYPCRLVGRCPFEVSPHSRDTLSHCEPRRSIPSESGHTRNELQLVGVTALFLASKYEEIYPPQVADIVSICDNAFSDEEIIQMEVKMLRALKYKITIPSAHCFLVRYLKAAHGNKRIVQLSSYILDSTLQNYELLEFLPSELASAAVMIARNEAGRNSWSPTLLQYTNYCEEDIIPVARAIIKAMQNRASHLDAVERKYSRDRFGSIAGTTFQIWIGSCQRTTLHGGKALTPAMLWKHAGRIGVFFLQMMNEIHTRTYS